MIFDCQIGNCPIEHRVTLTGIQSQRQSQIVNIGWLTRPGSQQLGAKWVDVKSRRAQGGSYAEDEGELTRGQQHPFAVSLRVNRLELALV